MHATELLDTSLLCTVLPVSCPVSAALMPADGTVKDSVVKQSANGGNVDVDNGDATCIAPGMASTFLPGACWCHTVLHLPELPGMLLPILSRCLAVLQAATSCGPQKQL